MSKRSLDDILAKVPPQALDLEEAILGAALLERSGQKIFVESCRPEDFYSEAHQIIAKAIFELHKEMKPVDIMTVRDKLTRMNSLNIVGGAYYLAQLTSRVSTTDNLEEYALILRELALKREVIQWAGNVHHKAYMDDTDIFEIEEEVKKFGQILSDGLSKSGASQNIKDLMYNLVRIMESKAKTSELTGVPTGFKKLDQATNGWQETDLIIMAARPGMGKTTLAIESGKAAAELFNMPVGIFSLEMSAIQLTQKMASSDTEISLKSIRNAMMTDQEWSTFTMRISRLSSAPIYIDDSAGLSITELESRARRWVSKLGVKLIIVDYIQLMRGERARGANREEEVSSISRGLKRIAKNLSIPVIAISQLSRDVEKRGGSKKPILSDLRESGSIEQDADMVIFLWRPSYYNIVNDEDNYPYPQGYTEVIIAKFRNGNPETIPLQFIPKYSKFLDLELNNNREPESKPQNPRENLTF